jgi:hypothetical protein
LNLKNSKHQITNNKQFFFVSSGLCGHFSGLSGLGIEICNLGFICNLEFGIWDLTKIILEKKIRLDK